MKISLIPHGAWSLAALGTFALGYQMAQPSESDTATAAAARILTVREGSAPGSGIRSPLGNHPVTGGSTAGSDATATGRPVLSDPRQIEALTKEALNDPNPLTRNAAFAKLLASMTPENVQSIMESMKTNRAGGDKWQLFLYGWGAMDSAGALAHAETLDPGAKARFLQATLPGWASKDPNGAIGWVDTMAEGETKNRFLATLVGGLADHNIGVATSYVLARAAAGDKQASEYLRTVAGEEIRKSGAAGATAWGERLPDSPLKGSALDQIAGAYTSQDPQAAAAWAAQYAASEYGTRVVEEVADGWAERDPKAAVSWLASLGEGPAKSEGTYSALREWTQRDPTAASKYLAALPPSPSKDSAVSGFSRTLAREDPEAAVIWAKTISNEKSREQAVTRAGQSWFLRDPAAATTWLQSAKLSPTAQKAILNPPKDDRRRG